VSSRTDPDPDPAPALGTAPLAAATLTVSRDPAEAADQLAEAFGGRTFAWRWLAAVARAVDERPR
jgi:hypothetical protein